MTLDTIDLIYDAFFAKRVVNAINEGKINSNNKKIFEEVLERISEIKKGQQQVSFKNITDNNLSSLIAYRQAIEILPILDIEDDKSDQCINKFITKIEEEVTSTLNKGTIEKGDLILTKSFFRQIRKLAIQESNRMFMTKQEKLPWLEATS